MEESVPAQKETAIRSAPVKPAQKPGDDVYLLKEVSKGKVDKRGREILDVLWAVQDFKIFKTEKGISPHFSDDEKIAADQRERYLSLGQELAKMNHLIHMLPGRWLPFGFGKEQRGEDPTRVYYERELARGVAQALTGDAEQGKETLAALAKRLEKRLRNHGRVIYFSMCLVSAAVIIGIASYFLSGTIGFNVSEIALAAIMGSLGALLSTASGLKNLRIDASASLFMNWVYGGQRMLVGVLGAVILYLAVRGGIALEFIPGAASITETSPLNPYKLAFISVLAGFSERLVPNLLDREASLDSEGSEAKEAESRQA